jgi:hypothetical protein
MEYKVSRPQNMKKIKHEVEMKTYFDLVMAMRIMPTV